LIISRCQTKLILLLLVMLAFCLAHLHFLLLPDLFVTWDRQTKDRLMVLRNQWPAFRPAYYPLVAHVDLNNSSLAALNGYTFHRGQFADVTRVLGAVETAGQMWDFVFASRTDLQADQALVRSTAEAGNVFSGMALSLNRVPLKPHQRKASGDVPHVWHPRIVGNAARFYHGSEPLNPFDDLAAVSRGVGSLSIQYDTDGVLRRVPLMVRFGDGFVPILPLMMACDYLGVPSDRIEVKPGHWIRLPDAAFPGSASTVDVDIPIDQQGNMLINYIGPWGVMDHYNMVDLLEAARDRDLMELWVRELAGRIVVVSDLTTGAADVGSVPGDSAFPLGGMHANILHSIFTRSFIVEVSEFTMMAIEAGLMLLVWLGAIRFSSAAFCISSVALGLLYLVGAMGLFLYAGILIGVVRPLQMLFFANAGILVYRYIKEEQAKMAGLRQRDEIRATFGRYLSNDVVEELMSSPEKRHLGGELKRVTFLVSDLRGFTALSATLTPPQVIDILNRSLEYLLATIAAHDGTVDEIQGDGLLVFFGVPIARDNDIRRAVACAIDMQQALERFNTMQRERGQPSLAMGIGIHSGDVVVGNIGSDHRAKYGAVGSAINTAYRIESYAVGGQVLVSQAISDALGDDLLVRNTIDVQFKGIANPVRLCDVEGLKENGHNRLPPVDSGPLNRLVKPVAIGMVVIDGKSVSGEIVPAQLLAIGRNRVDLQLPLSMQPFTEVKLLLTEPAMANSIAVYGKLVSGGGRPNTMSVALTSVPPAAAALLKSFMASDTRQPNRENPY
jgi:adenylate cyclase